MKYTMKRLFVPIMSAILFAACNNTSESAQSEENSVPVSEQTIVTNDTPVEKVIQTEDEPVGQPSFNGKILISPQHHATVTLTMGGAIHTTSLLPGSYVKKGDVIATLANPDFILLQQSYLEAIAQAEYLEAEYHRQERLSQQEAASQKRFQQSKAEYLSMKSKQEAAKAQLILLGVTPEGLQKEGIRPYLEIKSPISGYITGEPVNVGKYIPAGESICEVINKGETLLCLTVYEKDLKALSPGSSILFQVNGMGDESFEATLLSIGQEVDNESRSIEVYARIKENNNQFRPGMYVTARIEKK